MGALRLILADQLSENIATLRGADPKNDLILLCEVAEETVYVKHHKKKIAFLFAAMRHFAQSLREKNFTVRYVTLDDPENTGSFDGEVERAIRNNKPSELIVTEAGEIRVIEKMRNWQNRFNLPVDIREDDRFFCSHDEFNRFAGDKKQLRMEFFYREMRKKHHILTEADGKPTGGEWNYDKENRKSPPKSGIRAPKRLSHKKSDILKTVLKLVAEKFPDHFGVLEPFHYAVTRQQALSELEHFIQIVLPDFGDYQDAMLSGEPYLNHSLLSSYLNAGLLSPQEICKKAEAAYRAGGAPLNAVEGFIRQILGWREYVRGIYYRFAPHYTEMNFLNATEPLPELYWNAKTRMFCMAEAVRHTQEHAYSHHIQRLMITGNFALIAGLDVKQVQEWYLAVYSDAYEWVEAPNTLGMALFGDGGIMASKPYAASGSYIKRMSNFCDKCAYDPEIAVGEKACPFNALYWDFMARNEEKLRGNPRMPYVFPTWHKFTEEKRAALQEQARGSLQKMREGTL